MTDEVLRVHKELVAQKWQTKKGRKMTETEKQCGTADDVATVDIPAPVRAESVTVDHRPPKRQCTTTPTPVEEQSTSVADAPTPVRAYNIMSDSIQT